MTAATDAPAMMRQTWRKGVGAKPYFPIYDKWDIIPGDWLEVTMYGNGMDRPDDLTQVLKAEARPLPHDITCIVVIPRSWVQAVGYRETITYSVRIIRKAALPPKRGQE